MSTNKRSPLLDICDFRLSGTIKTDAGPSRMAILVPAMCSRPGEITAIIGRSGCGKSVLLSLIMGYPAFRVEGQLIMDRFRLFDADMPVDAFQSETRADQWRHETELSGGLFYLPQSFPVARTQRLKTRTVMVQIVQAMAAPTTIASSDAARRISEAFKRHEMDALLTKPIENLSGGERRRAELLARLVAMETAGRPAILVLDEPTTGFDPANARQFVRDVRGVVDRLNSAGVPVSALLSTHEMKSLDDHIDDGRHVIDRLCVVHRDAENCDGGDPTACTVIFDGPTDSALPRLFPGNSDYVSGLFAGNGERIFETLRTRPSAEWAGITAIQENQT